MKSDVAPPGGWYGVLKVISGNDQGKAIELSQELTTVGRGADQMLFLADMAVSRHHMQIWMTPEGYFVRDLDSPNGTLVNGKRYSGVSLVHLDQIEVGNTLLRFEHPPSQTEDRRVEHHRAGLRPRSQKPAVMLEPADPSQAENRSRPEHSHLLDNGDLLLDRYIIENFYNDSVYGEIYKGIDTKHSTPVWIHLLISQISAERDMSSEIISFIRTYATVRHPNLEIIENLFAVTNRFLRNGIAIITLRHPGRPLTELIESSDERGDIVRIASARHIVQKVGSVLSTLHNRILFNNYILINSIFVDENCTHINENTDISIKDIAALSAIPQTHQYMSRSMIKMFDVPHPFYIKNHWIIVAPELIYLYNVEQSPLADVFTLASIFYLIIFRTPPYEYQQRQSLDSSMARQIPFFPNVAPHLRLPTSWTSLRPVLERALAWNPADRYPNIPQFLDELAAACHQFPQKAAAATVPVPIPVTAPLPQTLAPAPTPFDSLHLGAEPPTGFGASVALAPWSVRVLGAGIMGLGLALPTLSGLMRGALSSPAAPLRPSLVELAGGVMEDMSCTETSCLRYVRVNPFAITATEVSNEQLRATLQSSQSALSLKLGAQPARVISAVDAARYCNRLSQLEGFESCYEFTPHTVHVARGPSCLGYRLPTSDELRFSEEHGVPQGLSTVFRIARSLRPIN